MNQIAAACLGLALLLFPLVEAEAGQFEVVDVYNSMDPPSTNSILGRVGGTARYIGSVDPNDQSALFQTTACMVVDRKTKICADGTGLGINAKGPFFENQRLVCNTPGCMGRRYIAYPCCGQTTVDFTGKGGAVIYHQGNPDIHEKDGPMTPISCKSCDSGCANGGGAGGAILLDLANGRQVTSSALNALASRYTLRRSEKPGQMTYLMDDWAVLSSRSASTLQSGASASSQDLASWLSAQAFLEPSTFESLPITSPPSTWSALLVIVPPHPDADRAIPLPEAQLAAEWLPGSRAQGTVLVRADFGEMRVLDKLEVLHSAAELEPAEISFLENNLRLTYASEKSHRVILYALIEFGDLIELKSSYTLLPECCTNPPTIPILPL